MTWRPIPGVGLIRVRKQHPSRQRPDPRLVVMAEKYRGGATLAAIGAEYGITRERVRQLLGKVGVTKHDRMKPPPARERRAAATAERIRRVWDLDLPTYKAMVAKYGSSAVSSSPLHRYQQQRRNAAKRGIGWELTFRDWWNLWQQSGKWEMRGRGFGYCMARKGDVGPYAVGNVYFCTGAQNASDGFNIDKPCRKRARRLPFTAHAYKVKTGVRWMLNAKHLPGKKYFGGFASREEAEAYGLSMLRAA